RGVGGAGPGLGAALGGRAAFAGEGGGRLGGAAAVADDVDDDDGDVVAAPAVDGQPHQLVGGVLRVLGRGQHRGDGRLRDLVEQAVGAEHEAVAVVGVDREDVDGHLVVDAEDPGDDVALRVHGRLLGRQAALAHQVGHQAVVGGHLVELAGGVAVAAGVAHVGDRQDLVTLVLDDGEGDDRRAHAGELGVVGAGPVDGGVGRLDGV